MSGTRRRPGPGTLFDALFPPACVVCGSSVSGGRAPACRICWHRLPEIAPPRCPRCGATRLLDLPGPGRCLECDPWPEGLEGAAAPFRMEGGASRIVHAFKYRGARALAAPMARSMERPARRLAGAGPAQLVPVPLAPARLRERGFNQALDLARALGEITGWGVRRALVRAPGGRRQARLGLRERRTNVSGRFAARAAGPAPAGEGGATRALLVDDVLTTGATAAACANALTVRGRPVAGVVVFARALQRLDGG